MTENDLDMLLSAPLASVDDDGFAARATYRIAQEQAAVRERREIIEWSALLLGAAVFLAFVPLGSVMRAIETLIVGSSLPVAITLAALILTVTFTRLVVTGGLKNRTVAKRRFRLYGRSNWRKSER